MYLYQRTLPYTRFLASIVALSLVFTPAGQTQGLGVPTPSAAMLPQLPSIAEFARAIQIPNHVGRIKEVNLSSTQEQAPLVIHIQDSHANFEAQTHISRILKTILEKNPRKVLIGLEAAAGPVQPKKLFGTSYKEAQPYLNKAFMRKGYLTGAEDFALLTEKEVELYGVEDPALYRKNLTIFRELQPIKEKYLSPVLEAEKELFAAQALVYKPELLDLTQSCRKYKRGEISFAEYARCLIQHGLKPQGVYFPKALQLAQLQDKLVLRKVEKQRRLLLEELRRKMNPVQLEALVQQSLYFKLNKISALDYYSFLTQMVEQTSSVPHLVKERYPDLFQYIDSLRLYAQIDQEKLFQEVLVFTRQVKSEWLSDLGSAELDRLEDQLEGVEKLVRLEMSIEEWKAFQSHNNELFLHKILSGLEFVRKQQPQAAQTIDFLQQELLILDPLLIQLDRFKQFYQVALQRDEAMSRNLFKKMEQEQIKVAILVAGGFHAEGLKAAFKKQGLSHVIVSPQLFEKEEHNPYLARLLNQYTPFERMLLRSGNRLGVPVLGADVPISSGAAQSQEVIEQVKEALAKAIHAVLVKEEETTLSTLNFSQQNPKGFSAGTVTIADTLISFGVKLGKNITAQLPDKWSLWSIEEGFSVVLAYGDQRDALQSFLNEENPSNATLDKQNLMVSFFMQGEAFEKLLEANKVQKVSMSGNDTGEGDPRLQMALSADLQKAAQKAGYNKEEVQEEGSFQFDQFHPASANNPYAILILKLVDGFLSTFIFKPGEDLNKLLEEHSLLQKQLQASKIHFMTAQWQGKPTTVFYQDGAALDDLTAFPHQVTKLIEESLQPLAPEEALATLPVETIVQQEEFDPVAESVQDAKPALQIQSEEPKAEIPSSKWFDQEMLEKWYPFFETLVIKSSEIDEEFIRKSFKQFNNKITLINVVLGSPILLQVAFNNEIYTFSFKADQKLDPKLIYLSLEEEKWLVETPEEEETTVLVALGQYEALPEQGKLPEEPVLDPFDRLKEIATRLLTKLEERVETAADRLSFQKVQSGMENINEPKKLFKILVLLYKELLGWLAKKEAHSFYAFLTEVIKGLDFFTVLKQQPDINYEQWVASLTPLPETEEQQTIDALKKFLKGAYALSLNKEKPPCFFALNKHLTALLPVDGEKAQALSDEQFKEFMGADSSRDFSLMTLAFLERNVLMILWSFVQEKQKELKPELQLSEKEQEKVSQFIKWKKASDVYDLSKVVRSILRGNTSSAIQVAVDASLFTLQEKAKLQKLSQTISQIEIIFDVSAAHDLKVEVATPYAKLLALYLLQTFEWLEGQRLAAQQLLDLATMCDEKQPADPLKTLDQCETEEITLNQVFDVAI